MKIFDTLIIMIIFWNNSLIYFIVYCLVYNFFEHVDYTCVNQPLTLEALKIYLEGMEIKGFLFNLKSSS